MAIIVWLAPIGCRAAGLRVSPSEITATGQLEMAIGQVLLVQNPSNASSSFQVYPDDFKEAIKITPATFILQPQETKVVAVEARFAESGVFKTNISVLAKPLAQGQLKTNAGVKIPLEVTIVYPSKAKAMAASLQKFFNQKISLGWLLVVLACLFLFFFVWFIFRRLEKSRV
jgi:hypothetical protein